MADGERRRTGSRRGRSAGCAAAVIAPFFLLAFVYWYNNRSIADLHMPRPAMPAVNGLAQMVRAAEMLKPGRHPFPLDADPAMLPTYSLADYEAAYQDVEPALRALHRAVPLPCRHPAIRSAAEMRSPALDNGGKLLRMARTLCGAAEYRAKAGRSGEAADLLLDGYEMGAAYPNGGGMYDEMVGEAMRSMCTGPIELLLPKLGRRDLARVAARLDRVAARWVVYSDIVLEGGRQSVCRARVEMSRLRFNSQPGRENSYWQFAGQSEHTGSRPLRAAYAARLAFGDKEAMLRDNLAFWEALSREIRGPYTGHIATPVPIGPPMEWERGDLENGLFRFMASRAEFDVLRVEVALLRCRSDSGRCPDRLGALAPKYLGTVPDDVCAGKPVLPLRYHVNGGGQSFVLYGVGPNMADDGGTFQRDPTAGGDIVAGHLSGR